MLRVLLGCSVLNIFCNLYGTLPYCLKGIYFVSFVICCSRIMIFSQDFCELIVRNSNYCVCILLSLQKKYTNMDVELLGTAVGKLRNRLHRLMKQRYALEADEKLTVEEFILLNMIKAKTDQILQNIAIATGKNKSVVMRMIDSLERKGFAKRTVNPNDRRENFLSITADGEKVLAQYQEIERKLSAELLEGIPVDRVSIFFEVVELLSAKLENK